jgi:hypothetical protein
MTADVRPVEAGGKFWVDVDLNGIALNRYGPFDNLDDVECAVTRMIQATRALQPRAERR